MKKRRIAIDFDGVLIDWHGFFTPDIEFGEPRKDAVEGVRFLHDRGYECYVFTARDKKLWGYIRAWLDRYGFPKMKVTNKKTSAIAYIDDRGIRFTNWQDICRYFG